MLALVAHVRAKVPSDHDMPCGLVLPVKLLLDKRGNVLLDRVLCDSLEGRVDCVLGIK